MTGNQGLKIDENSTSTSTGGGGSGGGFSKKVKLSNYPTTNYISSDIFNKLEEYQDKFQKASIEVNALDQKIKELEQKFSTDLKEKTKDYDIKIEKYKRDFENNKIRTLELITIFIAFFTFISVEVQVLKTAEDFPSVAGLSLIMGGMLLGFATLILYFSELWISTINETIVRNDDIKAKLNSISIFSLACIIIGIILLFLPDYMLNGYYFSRGEEVYEKFSQMQEQIDSIKK